MSTRLPMDQHFTCQNRIRFWKDFGFQGGYNGITFITNSGQFASHFQIFDTVFSGITCQNINDVYLSDFIINAGNTTNCSAACLFLLDFCQAVTVINADIIYGAAGFSCIYNSGLGQNTSPAYCKFTNVYFDSSAQGAVIDQCMGMTFTNCWFSNRPGNGAVVGFTATQGITFIGCLFANCAQNGCLVQVNAVGTNFIGCIFAGNSESSSGVYSGLNIAANTENFSVIGCISKGNYLGFSATQLYGILINVGTSNNFVITGNDVTGNGSAGISDGSSGTIKVIHSNIGYNSPGSAYVITVGSSPFTYTNNSGTPQLVYVANGTVSSITLFGATVYTSTNVAFVLPTNQSTIVTYSSLPNMTWGPVV